MILKLGQNQAELVNPIYAPVIRQPFRLLITRAGLPVLYVVQNNYMKTKTIFSLSIITLLLCACGKETEVEAIEETASVPTEATDHWPKNPATIRRVSILTPTSSIQGPEWEIVDGAPASHYGHRTKCRLIVELPDEKEFKVTVHEVVTLMQRDGIVYHISISPLPNGTSINDLTESLKTVFEENSLSEAPEWLEAYGKLQSYIAGTEEADTLRFKTPLGEKCDLSVSTRKLYRNKREDPTDFTWVYSMKIIANNQAIEEAKSTTRQ